MRHHAVYLTDMFEIMCRSMARQAVCKNFKPSLLPANWLEASCIPGHGMSAGKWAAAVTEIKLYSKQGRPVLVGTTSVERSEALAAMLKQEGALFLLGAVG